MGIRMSVWNLLIIATLYFLSAYDLAWNREWAKAAMVLFWGAGNLAVVWDLYLAK
jgi:hypothetical protein